MSRGPVLVGVTGGIGSGKSTVCNILQGFGCRLFDADTVARDLLVSDPDVVREMRRMFGNGVYSQDGSGTLVADRKCIASQVFADRDLLERLNGLVHPRVRQAFDMAVAEALHDGTEILVKEAAILFESGADKGLDEVIVVTADLETRIERVLQRGGGTREDVLKRIRAQWPPEKLVERAGYVIENNGSLEQLEASVEFVYRQIVRKHGLKTRHLRTRQ